MTPTARQFFIAWMVRDGMALDEAQLWARRYLTLALIGLASVALMAIEQTTRAVLTVRVSPAAATVYIYEVGTANTTGKATLTGIVSRTFTKPTKVDVMVRAVGYAAQLRSNVVLPAGNTELTFTLEPIAAPAPPASVPTALVGPEASCDFYAAPGGSGDGTRARPWGLQTALNQPPALVPGKTLCLLGGTYTGHFVSELTGAAGNRITVRSAPGEWAVLDGFVRGVLSGDIAATVTTIPVVDGSVFPLEAVSNVTIGSDALKLEGRSGNNLRVYFGLDEAHKAGETIVANGAALTGNGAHVIFRDFEITNSDPVRTDYTYRGRSVGLNMFAPESHVLNLIIHDTGQGLSFWTQASNSIAAGNILYNNGVQGRGHGIYTQNEVGTKVLRDNITFGNFGLGMQMYTTNGGVQIGFTWEGNVNVNNRYLFGGQQPMDDLAIRGNFLYGSMLELGYGDSGPHGRAVVDGNYVYAPFPFLAKNWNAVAVTNNKFYMMRDESGAVVRVNLPAGGSLSNYTFGGNDYLFGRVHQAPPFYLQKAGEDYEAHQFLSWKTVTGDSTSTYRGATPDAPTVPQPSGVDVFYRASMFESGRGHVVIYNYNGVSGVTLNLSRVGLVAGQSYQVRNGQNIMAPPIVTGIYTGLPVSVPLNALTVVQPFTNNGERNAETPQFAVLVIVPGGKS